MQTKTVYYNINANFQTVMLNYFHVTKWYFGKNIANLLSDAGLPLLNKISSWMFVSSIQYQLLH